MNILLIAGHGAGDPGAIGCGYEEADLTREVVSILKNKLNDYADIEVYPFERNAYYDVNRGALQVDWNDYDYVFEVHFNASDSPDAEGTEIYVTRGEEGTDVEECVIEKLGNFFEVRGVKRMNFNVIYSAKCAGVSSALLETCFITNQSDMDIYEENKDAIAQAIADGIIEGFGLNQDNPKPIPEPTPIPTPEPPAERIYQNGSTPESVYSDYYLTEKIGELNPYERCACLGVYEGRPIVRYEVDGTRDDEGNFNEKIGFVEWIDGVQ